jgi:ferredoxin
MNADPVCMKQHTHDVYSEEVVVNQDGTLRNVLVYITEGLREKNFDAPRQKVLLDQVGCVYTPHVRGLQVGQELEVVNSDPTLHNVHSLSKANPQFNVAQPMKGMKLTRAFQRRETLWSCTTCMACVEVCPVGIEHLTHIVQMRRNLVDAGTLDNNLQAALQNLGEYGNSFGQSPKNPTKWTQKLPWKIKDARSE